MLSFSKIGVNVVKVWNNAAKLAMPKMTSILNARTMETFSPTWEKDLGRALTEAKQVKKPVMLVIYRPWCTYCQKLSKEMASSAAMKKMEEHFVMAQVNEDDTYLDNKFAPDGGVRYVPRVLFLTPEGEVMKGVKNHKSYRDGTLYVYSEVDDIMSSMNSVAQQYMVADPSAPRDTRSATERPEERAREPTREPTSTPRARVKRASTSDLKKKRSNTKTMTTAYIKKR